MNTSSFFNWKIWNFKFSLVQCFTPMLVVYW